MKRLFFLVCFLSGVLTSAAQRTYSSNEGDVSIFSETPLENIDAHNTSIKALLNTFTRDVGFIVPIRKFKFRKAMMEEHFNEKYMESDKFPMATFKGRLNEPVDFSKEGETKVTSTGKLSMHGVERDVTCPGTVLVKNGEIEMKSEFNVLVKDYNITIPKLVVQNISENIAVKVNVKFIPYKK